MLDLVTLGSQIAQRRKLLKLTQTELSQQARLSRATLDALENGRAGELGFSKVSRLLTALGLELALQPAASHRRRPTLDDLMLEFQHEQQEEEEHRYDQGVDRRR